MDKISIIIPCYNVENYIDRCLDSIVNQTIGLDCLEIICVDDCSTDNTLSKLKEWEQRYPDNIMVITYEENIRQGGARNIGLEYSTGNLIGFIDSDDWIELDMYEILYNKMIENQVDVCKCKFIRDPGTESINLGVTSRDDVCYRFEKINGFYKYNVVKNTGNNGQYGGIWSGLYKKNILTENNLLFPERLAYEDNYWVAILNLYVSSLYIVDLPLYHYYVNNSSTILKRNSAHHFHRLIIEEMILTEYQNKGAFEMFKDELFESFIKRYWFNSLFIFFTRFDDLTGILDLNVLAQTVNHFFPEYIEALKSVTTNKNSSDPSDYLLTLLLFDELRTNIPISSIQNEYLRLLKNSESPA